MYLIVLRLILTLMPLDVFCLPVKWADDKIIFRDDTPWNGRTYSFGYDTSLGNSRKEKGTWTENNHGIKYLEIEGEYSYVMPDGSLRKVTYISNDKGYHESKPFAKHLTQLKENKNDIHKYVKKDIRNKAIKPAGKVNVFEYNSNDIDGIVFPDDNSEIEKNTRTTAIHNLGSSDIVTTTTDTNNTAYADYDYDDLGNKIGIPPDVLASLLGR